MQRSTITMKLQVDNEFGVLTRITALVRREGFNIKSLAVEVTENPELSLMLISVECLDTAIARVLGRLNKLECVKSAEQVHGRFDLGSQLRGVFAQLESIEMEGAGNAE